MDTMKQAVEQIKAQSGKKWVKGINNGLKDKGLGEHLNAWIPYVHGGLKCEMALLTVQYDPNIMSTLEEAWRDVLRMEKTVVDVLTMESDVLYVVSVIETHPGKKGKTNQKKGQGKSQENKQESKEAKVVEEMIKVGSIKDIDELFKKYTHEFKEEMVEDMKIVNERQKEYLRKMGETIGETEDEKKLKEEIKKILGMNMERLPECIYPIMMGMLNRTKIKKETKEEEENKEATRLKGYPHIHMAVAFTTTTGIMKDLREMKRKLLMYGPDVDFQKKDGTSTRRRRGRQVDIENDAKILGYIFKNSRHEGTMEKLGRMPVVLYNIRNEQNISNLYGMLYQKTGAAVMIDINPREKIEVKMPFTLEIINEKEKSIQTNLPEKETNKPRAQTKLMQMINMVETYLERNQMGITGRGTIYQRIAESRKSWRYWGTPGELYKRLTTKETVELLNKTKKSYEEYMTGGYENIFPYINIDYKWIEFNDFYFYIPTGEVVKKIEEVFRYECFAYCPEVKYEQIYPEMKITPKRWLRILENSGYIVEGELTEEGVKIVKGVYSIMKPKRHKEKGLAIVGESDAGKSSLIMPVILLFPRDTIVRLTDAGGFGLARLTRNPEIVISEEHHKNRLRRDESLQLLEGNIEMSVNIKQKVEEEVFVKARVIFLCNEKDWAYKQNISLLTMEGEKPEDKMDAAYTNRLIFCQMRSLPVEERSAETRDMMIREERSIIPLYAAKINFGVDAFKEMIEIV